MQTKSGADRRQFLQVLGGGAALGLAWSRNALAADTGKLTGKPLKGLFPIGSTPFTPDDKLDLECLQNQVKFLNKGGVHGFAWPQIASGWSTLTDKERFEGTEAILAAGKGGKTSLVIGVQTKGNDLPASIAFAKHAAKNGADAIISLPPEGDNKAVLEYYKAIGAATELPLIVQTIGDAMSVDFVVEMYNAIPTMKCVKDEVGNPLERVTQIRERTGDKLAVFSGNGVRTMMDEMRLGFAGHCPVTSLADLFAQAYDLYHAGKKREAFDMFGRIQAFNTIPNAGQYLLVARGVFKETTKSRPTPGMGTGGGAGGGQGRTQKLDEAGKKNIRESLELYLRPYLRA